MPLLWLLYKYMSGEVEGSEPYGIRMRVQLTGYECFAHSYRIDILCGVKLRWKTIILQWMGLNRRTNYLLMVGESLKYRERKINIWMFRSLAYPTLFYSHPQPSANNIYMKIIALTVSLGIHIPRKETVKLNVYRKGRI